MKHKTEWRDGKEPSRLLSSHKITQYSTVKVGARNTNPANSHEPMSGAGWYGAVAKLVDMGEAAVLDFMTRKTRTNDEVLWTPSFLVHCHFGCL